MDIAGPRAGFFMSRKKLSNAPLVEVKIVTGGKKRKPKKVCGGKSHHGYLGIEGEVIEIMTRFIKTH
jgi:hypothetical protein